MIYKANNIDVDKFLQEIERKEKNASYNHMLNTKIEEARYNQEMETLSQIEDMFYCSNYEKTENIDNTDGIVVITKQQYDDYQKLLNNFDYEVDSKIEVELKNWEKETLHKLVDCLKSEEYLLYGADGKKNICNISYEELDKVIAYAFTCTLDELKEKFKEKE